MHNHKNKADDAQDTSESQDGNTEKQGFLVLKMKLDQSIEIGDATIFLRQITGNSIKISIKAPRKMDIKLIK